MSYPRSSSVFSSLSEARADPAFALVQKYKEDHYPQKVDLAPGFYRDEDARPWILPSVRKAKQLIAADPDDDHEALPLAGDPGLLLGARKLVFGQKDDDDRIASIQTIAGTGANYLGARFLSDTLAPTNVWISDPSWVNHAEVWRVAGPNVKQRAYPYYDKITRSLNFDGMTEALQNNTVPGDIVILHACAHNPTGLDLSHEQWQAVAKICVERQLIPFFDMAYQGFATGDLAQDAWAVRYFFAQSQLEFFVAQSFSKNFGLYGERVGVLHVVTASATDSAKVAGALTKLSRAEITTAPIHGAKIVVKILNDESLFRQWQDDLNHMSNRMQQMRRRLFDALKQRKTPGSWGNILTDIGMFSFTGLSPSQVDELRNKYHVYLLTSGRISVTGLTESNVEYVAESIHRVVVGINKEDQ